MEQAKQRQSMTTDKRYIDRYHGPDDMVNDKNNKLTEIEAKGTSTGSTTVAKNSAREKQGSVKKNLRRAELMLRKRKKLNKPSNRQGGPYTDSELDLWQQVRRARGQKRHISTHTSTKTGIVKVVEQDMWGDKVNTIDDFTMDNFEEIKQGILEYFK